jgi:hypothetical protein
LELNVCDVKEEEKMVMEGKEPDIYTQFLALEVPVLVVLEV